MIFKDIKPNGRILGGDIMSEFLATLAFLGIGLTCITGIIALKVYNPNQK